MFIPNFMPFINNYKLNIKLCPSTHSTKPQNPPSNKESSKCKKDYDTYTCDNEEKLTLTRKITHRSSDITIKTL